MKQEACIDLTESFLRDEGSKILCCIQIEKKICRAKCSYVSKNFGSRLEKQNNKQTGLRSQEGPYHMVGRWCIFVVHGCYNIDSVSGVRLKISIPKPLTTIRILFYFLFFNAHLSHDFCNTSVPRIWNKLRRMDSFDITIKELKSVLFKIIIVNERYWLNE